MSATKLSTNLESLAAKARAGGISLGDVFDRFGEKGFGLLLVVLSLPSALPVPAPGYSTPFGIILAFLALQMMSGRSAPWAPQWARSRRFEGDRAAAIFDGGRAFFQRAERLIRPRLQWINSRRGVPLMGIVVLAMSCLMILPIPLTNTAPAMVVFLIGVGLTEDDGLFAGVAVGLGFAAVALYAGVIYLLLTVGREGIERIRETVVSALSG